VDGAGAPPEPPLPPDPPDADPPLLPLDPEPDSSDDEVSSVVVSVSSLAEVSGTEGGSVVTGALALSPLSSPPEKRAATTITNSRTQPIAMSRRRQ
jgi:hypothetical protein